MHDDVAVKEVCRLVTLDASRMVAHKRSLVEAGALGAEERSAATAPLAHVVHLKLL